MVLSQGKITDEGLERLRNLIQHPLRVSYQFNTEVTHDGLRHLAWGMGDRNPLWYDQNYARKTALGREIAPPSYLYTIHHTLVQMGLQGVHGFHSGTDWKIYQPIFIGNRITPICWIDDVVERQGKFGGRSVFIYFRTAFYDGSERVVAHSRSYTIRVERTASRTTGKESHSIKHWEDAELDRLEEQVLGEQQRGADPRFWEDVSVGDAVTPIAKGPLCMTDMVAWQTGSQQAFMPAFGMAMELYRRHPNWAYRDPTIGVLEPNARVHDTAFVAESAGVPAPYDIGVQRHQWLFNLLTHWIGDDGFIRECSAQYRKFNYFGDVQYLKGTVVGKAITDDGDHVVQLSVWAENQREEVTMPGTAVVALPSREETSPPTVRHVDSGPNLRAFLLEVAPKVAEAISAGGTFGEAE